jgi:DNA adenine methylase
VAYLEACCGSAAVFFAKQPVKIEVLNDKDRRYPLLFKSIRDHFEEVVEYCSKIEYSKSAFDESYEHLRRNPNDLPEWKLGCWALYQVTASFSGYPDGHSFAWRVKGANPALAWVKKIEGLAPYHRRLQSATFTQYDCIPLIRKCDKKGVLLYVDPPYIKAEFRYRAAKGFDHQVLAATLHQMKRAKVVLSHYDVEPYSSLYGDWRKDTRESTQSCKGGSEHSPLEDKPVTEALWFNYLAEPILPRCLPGLSSRSSLPAVGMSRDGRLEPIAKFNDRESFDDHPKGSIFSN